MEVLKNKFYSMNAKMNDFLYGNKIEKCAKKDKGINGVVVEVGIIIVGVVLLVVFNKEVNSFVTDMVDKASTKITTIFNSQTVS